jgi:outer membrane autotransporter protein
MAFYLGGGKESIFMDDRLFVTPSAALSGSYYMQEGYTESSGTSVPRVVEDYNYTSLQSELGIKASYMHEYNLSALVPEVHANWMHEFKADRQDVGYSLAGGTGNHTLHMQAPVEDVFEVGTGISWWVASRSQVIYEWSASIDGRFGDGYSEAIGGLRLTTRF